MVTLSIFKRSETCPLNPTKIIALGLNYRDHIAESSSVNVKGFTEEIPDEPILFPKTPNCLIGHEEPIMLPAFLTDYGFDQIRTDYEAELAFIVKNRCKNVAARDAMSHIFGFTCFNDVSQRNLQRRDKSGWFRAKSLDTYGPIGPQIVLPEDIGDPQNLNLECRLNGQVVQSSNTRYMIFSVPEILAFITRNMTLMPGDIVVTGTPSGVGPLHHGDVVEVEIEKIGVLRNSVIEETSVGV
ncbi:MAG TPA: fumarylacetoacetate hydrolase family protein [Thermodesulfobacteriota bacterium]|nr:fumarylacetoacetate hydrolase family protein [Deltaproteobacteria bacterium]HNR14767.1 fumarylacetoacetate hydrolase family protein [Thermodesulfobacteriota bacterium]HNU72157.1 fumarylacetoacetate hydrolase family protein [Thermodesulfobacteriota bacterium]HQO77301.1 fumarylacetoacetate hydrolase family protein [Thermodesulfobacteriota bacterium]